MVLCSCHRGFLEQNLPKPVSSSAAKVSLRARAFASVVTVDAMSLWLRTDTSLRVLVARWIGRPPGAGQHFLLDTGTFERSVVYYEFPAVRGLEGTLPTTG
jgi:probable phosphoglycerate mutase